MCASALPCLARAVGDALDQFEADWLARLNSGAKTVFKYAPRQGGSGLHSSVADAFISDLGFKAISFNWELLDASGDRASPRSALGELKSAIENDISNPSKEWLGERAAINAASQLLTAFDQPSLTVVSNRYDGLWNPIAGQAVEWGFVLFDKDTIALLLITET